jgi:hypothetical protein
MHLKIEFIKKFLTDIDLLYSVEAGSFVGSTWTRIGEKYSQTIPLILLVATLLRSVLPL